MNNKILKWLVWFCLMDYMGSNILGTFIDLGIVKYTYDNPINPLISLLFFIIGIAGFTYYTININNIDRT